MSNKRKNKGFYVNNGKKAKNNSFGKQQLAPNLNGFLITYNSQYTFCLNEAKKILQQFAVYEDQVS